MRAGIPLEMGGIDVREFDNDCECMSHSAYLGTCNVRLKGVCV